MVMAIDPGLLTSFAKRHAYGQATQQTTPFADGAEMRPRPFNQVTCGAEMRPCP